VIKGEEGWKVLDGWRITAEMLVVGFEVKPGCGGVRCAVGGLGAGRLQRIIRTARRGLTYVTNQGDQSIIPSEDRPKPDHMADRVFY
jgi:hypothetical protein